MWIVQIWPGFEGLALRNRVRFALANRLLVSAPGKRLSAQTTERVL
jgi:hypothetical protein